jgi:hypothetical protein
MPIPTLALVAEITIRKTGAWVVYSFVVPYTSKSTLAFVADKVLKL